jgi:hypothetical protein
MLSANFTSNFETFELGGAIEHTCEISSSAGFRGFERRMWSVVVDLRDSVRLMVDQTTEPSDAPHGAFP